MAKSIRRDVQRLLNPFRGVMSIIRYELAEAVTVNGLHRDIYTNNVGILNNVPANRHYSSRNCSGSTHRLLMKR
ncbi:MAG: hypothetical protein PVH46_08050 [Granulosicoccaceae bacterium]|jgi:hypothetical protein